MQILLTSVFWAPALLYLAAWVLGLRASAARRDAEPLAGSDGTAVSPASQQLFGAGSMLILLALVLHLASLYVAIAPASNIHVGFAHVASAAVWGGVFLLWLEPDEAHADAMRAMVLPLAAIVVLLPHLFPGRPLGAVGDRTLLVPHLLVGTLAYSVLLLALLHAILMASAERRLKSHPPARAGLLDRFLDQLPPLLSMERILFRLVGFGFVLLTLTAASGVFYSEQIFGRPFTVDHKTVFTLLAWAVFGVLLAGRWLRGWRGRTALRLTIVGFIVMLLGYVGSRFVLEAVLGRI